MSALQAEAAPCRRGTSNSNQRGNTRDRRRRREWVVETYRADVSVIEVTWIDGQTSRYYPTNRQMMEGWLAGLEGEDAAVTVDLIPAARCYRCGTLLCSETVTVDRIVPGAEGGTYGGPVRDQRDGRTNCRPACGDCNSETGGALGAARKAAAS